MKLNLKDFDGAAFDFDGTLADSVSTHERLRREAFTEQGFGHITAEAHSLGHTYGVNSNQIIAGVLKAAGVLPLDADPTTDETVGRLVHRKRELYTVAARHGLDAQPGAVELVRRLAAVYSGRVALVTTAYDEEVMPFIQRHGLTGIFESKRIITEDTLVTMSLQTKPAPDGYILARERLQIEDPARLLVIEDTPGGTESGKRAKATVLAVGTTNAEIAFRGKAYQPDYFVASIPDIELQ